MHYLQHLQYNTFSHFESFVMIKISDSLMAPDLKNKVGAKAFHNLVRLASATS